MNLAQFFKHDFSKGDFILYNKRRNVIFIEYSDKFWIRYERDENGNATFREDSNKFWARREFDENGNVIFLKDSNGSTFGAPKSQEVEMTVRELQDLVSEQKGANVKLKIKE